MSGDCQGTHHDVLNFVRVQALDKLAQVLAERHPAPFVAEVRRKCRPVAEASFGCVPARQPHRPLQNCEDADHLLHRSYLTGRRRETASGAEPITPRSAIGNEMKRTPPLSAGRPSSASSSCCSSSFSRREITVSTGARSHPRISSASQSPGARYPVQVGNQP